MTTSDIFLSSFSHTFFTPLIRVTTPATYFSKCEKKRPGGPHWWQGLDVVIKNQCPLSDFTLTCTVLFCKQAVKMVYKTVVTTTKCTVR